MKPLVLPLVRAHDVLHWHDRDQRRLAGLADFRFRHPGAAKWRIGEERVGRDAIAHRRGSWSSRFAATISKSLHEVCVNAPRPLQSPIAQTPETLVRN